jgi:hypothetical protein
VIADDSRMPTLLLPLLDRRHPVKADRELAGLSDLPRAHRGINGAHQRTARVELRRQRQAAIRPAMRFTSNACGS